MYVYDLNNQYLSYAYSLKKRHPLEWITRLQLFIILLLTQAFKSVCIQSSHNKSQEEKRLFCTKKSMCIYLRKRYTRKGAQTKDFGIIGDERESIGANDDTKGGLPPHPSPLFR